MQLPQTIRIQLEPVGAAEVRGPYLVALDVHYQGRYYFGALLGLTDEQGRLAAPGELVAAQFAEDQRSFPMDYRVALAACDEQAIVHLDGGAVFEAQRHQAAALPLVSPQAKAWWSAARNQVLTPATTTLPLDGRTIAEARLAITSAGTEHRTA